MQADCVHFTLAEATLGKCILPHLAHKGEASLMVVVLFSKKHMFSLDNIVQSNQVPQLGAPQPGCLCAMLTVSSSSSFANERPSKRSTSSAMFPC